MSQASIADCLRLATHLQSVSDSPRLDTEVLLAWALQKDRSYLYTWPDKKLASSVLEHFKTMLQRREKGEPVAYILGEQEFWSLPLYVDASTLIPRPETECLVEYALSHTPPSGRVLDLGTGTGAIALAIAKTLPAATVVAVDYSPQAVALARRNQDRHQLTNVTILQSDWFAAVEGRFDLVVSNPPYIGEDDVHLTQGDLRFEPRSALVASSEGLRDIQHIVRAARSFLNTGASLIVEHGWQQAEAVREIFVEAGYHDVGTWQDYSHNDRLCFGRYSLV